MTIPCEQEQNIKHILGSLERMESSQERLVSLLEKTASQDARLNSLEDRSENTYRDLNEVFTRLRECELNQAANGHDRINATLEEFGRKIDMLNPRIEKLLGFYRITTHKYAIYFYSFILILIALGFASDIMNHGTWVKEVWTFWK